MITQMLGYHVNTSTTTTVQNQPPTANNNTLEGNMGDASPSSSRSSTGDDIVCNPEPADSEQHENMTEPTPEDETELWADFVYRATRRADHLMNHG